MKTYLFQLITRSPPYLPHPCLVRQDDQHSNTNRQRLARIIPIKWKPTGNVLCRSKSLVLLMKPLSLHPYVRRDITKAIHSCQRTGYSRAKQYSDESKCLAYTVMAFWRAKLNRKALSVVWRKSWPAACWLCEASLPYLDRILLWHHRLLDLWLSST